MKNYFFYDTPIGRIAIAEEDGKLAEFHFERRASELRGVSVRETPVHKEAYRQLLEYFGGVRKNFELPLSPKGTAFQAKVWQALTEIPYGETRTYGQIAAITGNPKASRAVGLANNRNPIPVFIPCHRVIGADGRLVGFGGGLGVKAYLLELERKNALP